MDTDRGLWTVYTKHLQVVASLWLGLGGKTDVKTWHERSGYPSDRQTTMMINKNIIPNEAEGRKEGGYDICLRSKPNRRLFPKTPEKSGDIVVQVDYMPVGHSETGWKGEVGAYVYSSRESVAVLVLGSIIREPRHGSWGWF